jgi:hypothetical protein
MERWRATTKQVCSLSAVTGLVFAAGILITGCAATPPKEPPTPSPGQVRSNADRTFEKLKQEERERQVTAPAVSR